MAVIKRILNHTRTRRLLAALGAVYLRVVYRTTRWELWGTPQRDAIKANEAPIIACFWHNRLMLMSYPWQEMLPKPFYMVQSAHRDGVLAGTVINHLGLKNIYVERKKGGLGAFRTMLSTLKNGGNIGFTPDGPKGPRQRMTLTPLLLAQKSGALLYPTAASISRRRVLNTWDRFLIIFPFSRGITAYGEPLSVPKDADADELERLRLLFEGRMNALAASVDAALGFVPIEAA
jgi:lysophospholipid acyltransferase (LPLAT)-like uncharacterized protein